MLIPRHLMDTSGIYDYIFIYDHIYIYTYECNVICIMYIYSCIYTCACVCVCVRVCAHLVWTWTPKYFGNWWASPSAPWRIYCLQNSSKPRSPGMVEEALGRLHMIPHPYLAYLTGKVAEGAADGDGSRIIQVVMMIMMMTMMTTMMTTAVTMTAWVTFVRDPFWNGMGHHWEMTVPTLLHRRLDSFRQISNSDYSRPKEIKWRKNLTPQLFGRGKAQKKSTLHSRPASKWAATASDLVLFLFQYHKEWPKWLQLDRLADPALLTCKAIPCGGGLCVFSFLRHKGVKLCEAQL